MVEVLSPSTCKRDRTEKTHIYARCGVDEYWIVDPDLRIVTVRTLAGDRYAEGPSIVRGARGRRDPLPRRHRAAAQRRRAAAWRARSASIGTTGPSAPKRSSLVWPRTKRT